MNFPDHLKHFMVPVECMGGALGWLRWIWRREAKCFRIGKSSDDSTLGSKNFLEERELGYSFATQLSACT